MARASLADSVAAAVAAADAMANAIGASRERSAPSVETTEEMIAAPTAANAKEPQLSSAPHVPRFRRRAWDAITITVLQLGISL